MHDYPCLRAMLAIALGGGALPVLSNGCTDITQDVLKDSIKEGTVSWITGNVGTLDASVFGDLFVDLITGFGGGGRN